MQKFRNLILLWDKKFLLSDNYRQDETPDAIKGWKDANLEEIKMEERRQKSTNARRARLGKNFTD